MDGFNAQLLLFDYLVAARTIVMVYDWGCSISLDIFQGFTAVGA